MFDLTLLADQDRERQQASSPISKPIGIVRHVQESPGSAAQFRNCDGFFGGQVRQPVTTEGRVLSSVPLPAALVRR